MSEEEQVDRLAVGTALRNIGWLSFWGQLVLTVVSAVILLFSVGVTNQVSQLYGGLGRETAYTGVG